MASIAIITARGGSKRIPKKNIKDFCGKPIIAYSIEAAKESNLFEEVMVSTDSEEIAEIAKQYGANVPFLRSDKNSNDYATTADVLSEVLEEYSNIGKHYDYMCCIYPTAPFITANKLKEAMRMMIDEKADSLMPVVKFGFPPQRGMVVESNSLIYKYPKYAMSRSQDLEPMYHDSGQFYLCKVSSFAKNKSLVGGKTVPLVMPEEEVQDIDNISDWKIAEIKYKIFREKGENRTCFL